LNSAPRTGRLLDRDRPELTAAFMGAALVLALGLQVAMGLGGDVGPTDGLAARRPHLVSAPVVADFPAILHAPLFTPDRRPSDADAVSARTSGPLDKYAVLGVTVGGALSSTLVAAAGAPPVTVKTGELLEGWRLEQVARAKVVFEHDGVRQTLLVGAPSASATRAAEQADHSSTDDQ
jgi:hypothetical protein